MSVARSLGRLAPSTSALFLCDMQVHLSTYITFSLPTITSAITLPTITSVTTLPTTQVKFRPMISHFEAVVGNSARVLAAAAHMELPVLATEQYPK